MGTDGTEGSESSFVVALQIASPMRRRFQASAEETHRPHILGSGEEPKQRVEYGKGLDSPIMREGTRQADREIRLALVMNGGVSLAVWMGGVTAEIDALRRASFGSGVGDEATFDLWKTLIDGFGVRLIVDIIAGTSAGGINGAVLATAIARGQALPSLRDTWIETADFDSSLIDKDPRSDSRSVLDGDFFLRQLRRAFGAGPQTPYDAEKPKTYVGPSRGRTPATVDFQGEPPAGIDPELAEIRTSLGIALERERHCPRAVTLVMTGTALRGKEVGYADATGQAFQHPDSRVRFTFRRDVRGETDDFADEPGDRESDNRAPIATDRLARAARATASFPGAFEPTFVSIGPLASPVDEALEDVPEGPDMTGVTDLTTSRWVIDGGVLDNEPFNPVLDELIRRPLDTDVRRVLAYVVPSIAGEGEPPRADVVAGVPGIVESVLGATNLPRELGILDDLTRLRELQFSAEVNRAMRVRLLDALLGDGSAQIVAAAAAVYDLYRRRRLEGSIWENRVSAATGATGDVADLRPLPTPVHVPNEFFAAYADRPWLPPAIEDARTFDAIIEADPADWQWGFSVALRFVRAMIGRVRDALEAPQSDVERTDLSAAALTLSACMQRVREVAERFEKEVAKAIDAEGAFERPDEDVLARIDLAFNAAAGEQQSTREILGQVVRSAALAAVRAPAAFEKVALPGDSEDDKVRSLLRAYLVLDVLEGLSRDATGQDESPRFTFHRFGLNPHTWYFDGGEKTPGTKLAGTRFGHFGAFFKQAWRWHDWIWGRLDGASQLVEVLFDVERLPLDETRKPAFARLRTALVTFDDEAAGLALDNVKRAAKGAAREDALERLRDRIVRRLHRQILLDELPGLVTREDVRDLVPSVDPDADDDQLRQRLERIHYLFTTTSLASLTAGKDGREGKWLTVASGLRALGLDERVPPPFRGPLGWAAGWARSRVAGGVKGGLFRTGESAVEVSAKVVGVSANVVGAVGRGGSAVWRAGTNVTRGGRRFVGWLGRQVPGR